MIRRDNAHVRGKVIGRLADGLRPDRWDLLGTVVWLARVGVIMYAPRLTVSMRDWRGCESSSRAAVRLLDLADLSSVRAFAESTPMPEGGRTVKTN